MAGAGKRNRLQQRKKKQIFNDAVQYNQPEAVKNKKGKFLFKLLIRITIVLALIGCTASIISRNPILQSEKQNWTPFAVKQKPMKPKTKTWNAF